MKIKPQIYAKILISGLDGGNIKDMAKNFWYKLQRNNQYKDLPKIIECLDLEYARQNNKVLVKVYSEKLLNQEQIAEIEKKLVKKLGKELIFQNIVIPNQTAGIVVKIDDTEIDLSLGQKVNQLKNALNK